jgi:CrcB protein
MIENLLAVAAGGALGAVLRAGLILAVAARAARWTGVASPGHGFAPALATLLANTLGCLLLGAWLFASFPTAEDLPPVWVQLLVTTGLCGGLTTFSTVCADTVRLREGASGRMAVLYLLTTLAAGFVAFHLLLAPFP